MKTLIKPAEQGSALMQWRGAQAKLWLFHVSLNRMVIQLYRKGDPESLYLVALGCEHFSGPLRWKPADIVLRSDPPDQWGEVRRHVLDSEAGVELICSDVTMVRMPPTLPPDPFHGLFADPIRE